MLTAKRFAFLALIGLSILTSIARAQNGAYIGFVYPAGGQQGETVQIQLGGQRLDGVNQALVSGTGVEVEIVKYYRKLGNQEITILREQLLILRPRRQNGVDPPVLTPEEEEMADRIQARISSYVNNPACAALSSLVILDVTIAPDAEPGAREIRLVTAQGVTNPMVFYIGQTPEVARAPMKTCLLSTLGKEQQALRNRPEEEIESQITIPCTVNGQVAPGEVNQYRFEAKQGQRLVISAKARELVPYIADAVPGWFQPVVSLCNADGDEVAYNDDFRFKPDPTLSYEVAEDGEYVLTINDALYRGREDFVYRITIGETPFVTSIFPLGGRVGENGNIETVGWNLGGSQITAPGQDVGSGVQLLTTKTSDGLVSNAVPFALDTLPEVFDQEENIDAIQPSTVMRPRTSAQQLQDASASNNEPGTAQAVLLPVIVNGRIDQKDDWDVFQFEGSAGDTVVLEVTARRLDSPLDSMIKLTDAEGTLIALNDDAMDVASGLNTHHADSYVMVELPSDGVYYAHIGDAARDGGEEFAYRLRISQPRPDFELRVVPINTGIRSKAGTRMDVYVIRKDGFDLPIRVRLQEPHDGFNPVNMNIKPDQGVAPLYLRTTLTTSNGPISLVAEGIAWANGKQVVHEAIPAEDRMQAFLWRHLVPTQELALLVYDPSVKPPPSRVPAPRDETTETNTDAPPRFTPNQVAGRLRQLKALFEEWLLTDQFYNEKVAECEASL
jgi:hypothetical protein